MQALRQVSRGYPEALHGGPQYGVIRVQAQSGAPNVSCALLLVQAPQHFTQVGCNFCIGRFSQACSSNVRACSATLTEQHPAQTVGDEGRRVRSSGLFYQLLCLLEALTTIGQGSSPGVVGMVVVGLARPIWRSRVSMVSRRPIFRQHGLVVEQIDVLWCQGSNSAQVVGLAYSWASRNSCTLQPAAGAALLACLQAGRATAPGL